MEPRLMRARKPLFEKKQPQPQPPKAEKPAVEQAEKILRDYWGPSGPDRILRAQDLRALKLGKDDVEALLDGLPPKGTPGPTGQCVDECYRVLERLA